MYLFVKTHHVCAFHYVNYTSTPTCVYVFMYTRHHHTHTHCTTTALATSGSLPQPLPRSSSSRPCPHAHCPAKSQCSGQQDLRARQVWDSSTRAAWRARACGSSSQSTAHLASPPAAHASQCCSHILALPQTHQASLLWPFSLPEILLPQRAAFLTSIRPRRLPYALSRCPPSSTETRPPTPPAVGVFTACDSSSAELL